MADKPIGRNQWNKFKPIGIDQTFLSDNEGTDAKGRQSQVVRDEYPARIDEVNSELFYLGWAELGVAEDNPRWKIRKIQKVGTVWIQQYANGEETYVNSWADRSILNYS